MAAIGNSNVQSETSGKFVDARDFGVRQGNSVDSRAALQAALDSIKTSGGTVWLAGNNQNPSAYYLSGPVFFNGSFQRLLGAGSQSCFISTLGPAFVLGQEPKYWNSPTSYVDTDTSETVACRDGNNEFILDGRYREAISRFATGGFYGAGSSGQPALESVPGAYYGLRTRGVVKGHFPGNKLATAAKKSGISGVVGWEVQDKFTINIIYFAHGGKINGGLCGVGKLGGPDPWIVTGDGTDFWFNLSLTNDELIDRTQFFWKWPQPETTGLHRISIQIDLTNGSERVDIWQDRIKVAPTVGAMPTSGYVTTLVANVLKPPYNIIAPWRHWDFTIASSSNTVGEMIESGTPSDYTIIGVAGFASALFDVSGALGNVGATLTRLDAATVTDGNTAMPTSDVYNNSLACLGISTSSGHDLRMFAGSLFSSWGMICPRGGPNVATDVTIEGVKIIGQADQDNCDGITTLPTLRLRIRDVSITTGFYNSIGGFEHLVSYPLYIEDCEFGSPGNHILLAGFAMAFVKNCNLGYVGRRSITSCGSFLSLKDALVNEYGGNALSFFAGFSGRNVGAGLFVENVMTNNEGPRTIPKIAAWYLQGSLYVSSNDFYMNRAEIGSLPCIPSIVIDMDFPPGQSYKGSVEIKNMNWAPSAPAISIRGNSAKGYVILDRGGCQHEVLSIRPSTFAGVSQDTSPVISQHYDFAATPNLGGWIPKSHQIFIVNPSEGAVKTWGVKTGGTEGSISPPVWEPVEYMPSRNPNALTGDVQATLHVRVSADHSGVAAPVELWNTHINDSQANLILQKVLTGTATFPRDNLRIDYDYGQELINASYAGSAVSSSSGVTNDLATFWNTASAGQKTNKAALSMISTNLEWTYSNLKRLRAGFLLGIGTGSTPVGFCTGRTDYTVPAFLISGTYPLASGDIVAANSTRDGSWCHYMQNMTLDYVFGDSNPSFPATGYFGLSSTAVTASGTGATELSGSGYARVPLAFNSTNFGAHDEYLSTWSNKVPIAFSEPAEDWGWARYGIMADSASGGNILAKWPIKPIKILNGDDAPTYYARALHFQI